MNGLLVINKPFAMSSHDVVNAVRRIFKTRRVGHTGTLDPLATGVLVLLLGPATRLAQFVSHRQKSYRALIELGKATSTYDAEGEITAEQPVHVTQQELQHALMQFQGEIQQIPPMYSAIKVKGQKLYKLARQGKSIALKPRPVTIYQLTLVDWSSPELRIDVTCSAGTYIRSLAHDLGQKLGCGAYLKALTRTAVGEFTLEQSYTLEQLQALAREGCLNEALRPPQAALSHVPAVVLSSEQEKIIRYGQATTLQNFDKADIVQAHNHQGQLIAILIPVADKTWRPKIVFPEDV